MGLIVGVFVVTWRVRRTEYGSADTMRYTTKVTACHPFSFFYFHCCAVLCHYVPRNWVFFGDRMVRGMVDVCQTTSSGAGVL